MSPANVPGLGPGDDEDERAEVKDEGEGSRSGCYSADETLCPLPPSPRQLGRGVASFAFSLLVSCAFNEGIV